MNLAQQKKAATEFAEKWQSRGYEKGETHSFWTDFLRDVVGLSDVSTMCKFEYPTPLGGFIDALIPDSGVLIEQKSLGIDLDKAQERQGKQVTPFQQALAYAQSMARSAQPRFIIVSNFETFRIHDLEKEGAARETDYTEVSLANLADDVYLFNFITDPANSRSEREKQVSIEAGAVIGRLHDQLKQQYLDPDSEQSLHYLNVLCVRLVFCLYAEDAGIFGQKDMFLNYLKRFEADQMRKALLDLFKVLDTPENERDPYLADSLKAFPYVNGGLFKGVVEIPNFTPDIRFLLLHDACQQTDWTHISPTIFGGVFESTINPETRRTGGMHYTSPENIHKVIDPLFYDDLHDEFLAIKNGNLSKKSKQSKYRAFQEKISSLKFLDPACGSGNFLTETYVCLRRLENDVLAELLGNQTTMELDETYEVKVSINQFYGIEINDFAVRVANTALWIAELQANQESASVIQRVIEDLPLRDSAHIVCGNALRMDWNDVLPASECDYVMGNPPFYGARNQTPEQKAEIQEVFDGAKNSGNIDYVAGWYMKAADYIQGTDVRCAFVSTNSICQGEQVANIWSPLFAKGIHINFAHRTFLWSTESTDSANVAVIIVGFSLSSEVIALFLYEAPGSSLKRREVKQINAYLSDAPNAFVYSRNKPICDVLRMGIGNKPIDGGNYLFPTEEKEEFLLKEPTAEKYFRPWIGSREFINGYTRWCLWLGDISAADLAGLPESRKRIEAVRVFRLESKSEGTRKIADKPTRFHVENMPAGNSVIIPKVSSERRHYIPIGLIGPETLCSDLVFLVPNATLYYFGILTSQFHNAWMRTVAGRLESRYRYSAGVVYNNFIWPDPTETQKTKIEELAQAILDARSNYPDSSLADMYDPDNDFLFPDLVQAHKALDKAVEEAYGVNFNGDEQKIVAYLFELYAANG